MVLLVRYFATTDRPLAKEISADLPHEPSAVPPASCLLPAAANQDNLVGKSRIKRKLGRQVQSQNKHR